MFDGWLPLVERRQAAEETLQVFFDATGVDIAFTAGQYLEMFLDDLPEPDPEGTRRSFSIASAPVERGRIMITTRQRPTPFKKALAGLPLGTPVHVSAPHGSFTLHEKVTRPAVLLAGGIGVTPFRSMIVQALAQPQSPTIVLLYSNRTQAATAFLEEFQALQKKHPGRFTLVATVTDEPANTMLRQGRLDDALLDESISHLSEPIYYMAGPPPFVEAMKQLLLKRGISHDDIRSESFTGYATARQ